MQKRRLLPTRIHFPAQITCIHTYMQVQTRFGNYAVSAFRQSIQSARMRNKHLSRNTHTHTHIAHTYAQLLRAARGTPTYIYTKYLHINMHTFAP